MTGYNVNDSKVVILKVNDSKMYVILTKEYEDKYEFTKHYSENRLVYTSRGLKETRTGIGEEFARLWEQKENITVRTADGTLAFIPYDIVTNMELIPFNTYDEFMEFRSNYIDSVGDSADLIGYGDAVVVADKISQFEKEEENDEEETV